jgi:hypothetical protein
MKLRCLALALALVLIVPHGFAAPGDRVEMLGAFQQSGASQAMRDALQPTGYRILLQGSPVAEIWLRNGLPVSGKKDEPGANYASLLPGTFIGVITLPKPAVDFRGQSVKPDTYTLRYVLLPQDGDHLGVAPNRDFLLLIPLADDPGPATAMKYDQLVKLSPKATGTAHPAVLSLVPPGAPSFPSIHQTEDGYSVFAAKLKTEGGELPLALVVKGTAAQ